MLRESCKVPAQTLSRDRGAETRCTDLAMTSSSSRIFCSAAPSALVMLAHTSARRAVLSKSPPKAM